MCTISFLILWTKHIIYIWTFPWEDFADNPSSLLKTLNWQNNWGREGVHDPFWFHYFELPVKWSRNGMRLRIVKCTRSCHRLIKPHTLNHCFTQATRLDISVPFLWIAAEGEPGFMIVKLLELYKGLSPLKI